MMEVCANRSFYRCLATLVAVFTFSCFATEKNSKNVENCFNISKIDSGLYLFQIYSGITAEIESTEAPGAYWSNYLFMPIFVAEKGRLADPYEILRSKGLGYFRACYLEGKTYSVSGTKGVYGTLSNLKCFDSLEFIKSEDYADYEKCEGVFKGETDFVNRTDNKYHIEIASVTHQISPPLVLVPNEIKIGSTIQNDPLKQKLALQGMFQKADSLFHKTYCTEYENASTNASSCDITIQELYPIVELSGWTFCGISEVSAYSKAVKKKIHNYFLFVINEKNKLHIIKNYGDLSTAASYHFELPKISTIFDFDKNGNDEIVVLASYSLYDLNIAKNDPRRFKGHFRIDLYSNCGNDTIWTNSFSSNLR